MPKVSEEHRAARRDQIARAAMQQFVAQGIHSTTTDSIARAAGVSAGAIYTHFASKDEIISYVARNAVSSVFIGLESLLEADPLPSPQELATVIMERIPQAGVPIGFMVQVWGEAVSNPDLRLLANEVYTQAFDTIREYATLWLSAAKDLELRDARAQADQEARVLLGVIYAHILQTSLIESYEASSSPPTRRGPSN